MEALEIISKIADRAEGLAKEAGYPWKGEFIAETIFEINQKCPLHLDELLIANDYELIQEVIGYFKHFDIKAGKFNGFFKPMFTK